MIMLEGEILNSLTVQISSQILLHSAEDSRPAMGRALDYISPQFSAGQDIMLPKTRERRGLCELSRTF